jgi:hypothetical protein
MIFEQITRMTCHVALRALKLVQLIPLFDLRVGGM